MRRIRSRRSISHNKRRDGVEDEGERGGGIYKRGRAMVCRSSRDEQDTFLSGMSPSGYVLIPDFL